MLNRPSLVVTAVRLGLDCPASIRVTVTPGMAAPDVSTTRPVRRPATCAASGVSETKLSASKDHTNRIHCLPQKTVHSLTVCFAVYHGLLKNGLLYAIH